MLDIVLVLMRSLYFLRFLNLWFLLLRLFIFLRKQCTDFRIFLVVNLIHERFFMIVRNQRYGVVLLGRLFIEHIILFNIQAYQLDWRLWWFCRLDCFFWLFYDDFGLIIGNVE